MPQNVPAPSPQASAPQYPAGWPERLMAALELSGVSPDTARLSRAARIAAAASGQDDDAAATAFIAGYAAGLAEGSGQAGFDRAHAASLRAIERLLAAEVTAPSAHPPRGRAPAGATDATAAGAPGGTAEDQEPRP
ncbi:MULTISPECIES: hypothetical protein [Citricoccus]|uniref:hypothetical protein n=1 Tax=Citricoccus TaxID=169133 RepID=UPI000255F053|nr:hypothetical protein [Citricoccus sp. CH26A]